MTDIKIKFDNLPTHAFHKRIAFLAAGGPFCDGYLFGIIVVALPLIAKNLSLTSVQVGLLGSASLIGMFIGGILFGPVTDKFGRQSLYVLNLLTFLVGSLAFFITSDFTSLFVVRLIMGVALGADYPIATALACEFLPKRLRGPILSSLMVCFWVGFTVSLALGFIVPGSDSGVWRMILASSAIPSAIFLVLRLNVPESPRWLLSVGKVEQARQVVKKYLGEYCDFESLRRETPFAVKRRGLGLSSIRELFAQGYGRTLLFCAVFWTCQIAPSLAIKTFQPMLLKTFGVTQPLQGTLVIISFAVLGTIVGMLVINRIGRRSLLLWSSLLSTIVLFLLATTAANLAWFAILCFAAFTVAEAAGSALQFVYPNEVFPTELRATGMGLAMSLSRLGSAAAIFLMPVTLESLGRPGGLFIAGSISAVGLVVSYFLAPETTGLPLSESGRVQHNVGSTQVKKEAGF